MSLQEICLIGQLMMPRFSDRTLWPVIGWKYADDAVGGKNVVFIVYNFFEKCLNQSLAAAFRAPKRCGLLFN